MAGRRLLIFAVGCAVVAGCGASDRAPDAATVAERFHAAIEHRDGNAACSELSESTAGKLEQQAEKPCEEAVLELDLPGGEASGHTTAYVTSAAVSRAEGGTTFLDESDAGWKVSAAGCVPTAADLPYDCRLED